MLGELAYWRWRAGSPEPPPDGIAEPFALQLSGDWRAAAERWRELGCPYESARALAFLSSKPLTLLSDIP